MATKRIHVTRRIPVSVKAALEEDFEVTQHDSERSPGRADLLAAVSGADGLVTVLTDRVDAELLDAAGPQLRVVANYAVGFDNVDLDACNARGVVASNTPDVLTAATAEFALALMLASVRRVSEGDRFIRTGEPWVWAPTFMLGGSLRGRKLGIVGLGRIGLEVARLAEAFGMSIAYTDEVERTDVPYAFLSFDELISTADVVTLHCPLTPGTRHLIGRDELAAMKPGAHLVNTSRGPVVDEAALAEALRNGEIEGAALDVFEREPEVPAELSRLDNIVLAPHIASATLETREAMGELCVSALRSVLLEGTCPANALNPAAWQASGTTI